MKKFAFILLTLLPIQLLAQSLITDSAVVLKKGIYKNYNEFRTNSPSINIDFKIEERAGVNAPDIQGANPWYLVVPKNSFAKTDSIWGICDGKDIYVSQDLLYKKNNLYYKLKFVGLFSIYSTMEASRTSYGSTPSRGAVQDGVSYTVKDHIVNINTGKHAELTQGVFITILENDPELTKEFNELKRGEKNFAEYIIKYSLKHRNQVKQ